VKSNKKPNLWVYLTHFQALTESKEYKVRFGYLATSIFYLSQIDDYEVKIKIITNLPIDAIEKLAAPINSRIDDSTLEQYIASESDISVEGKKFDWLLTWVHKSLFLIDLRSTQSNADDLFLVLEDDALFTSANLEYFVSELIDLKEVGLLPSFIRSEWSDSDACWTHEDPIGRITQTATYFSHPKNENKRLMQLENPFSASILLNYPLAVEYFESESSVQALACYKHPVIYDIGSSACLGLIMEKIPKGYINRVAVVCNGDNSFPIPGSVVRHLGDRYARDKWHRNVRLYDQDDYPDLPTHRNSIDYLRRLFKRDVLVVLRKYFFSESI
jgi:hypothetical protein